MSELTGFIEDYLRRVAARVPLLAREGKGTEVLGGVAGRSALEDVEIGIDRICDELFQSSFQFTGLTLEVHSEHGLYRLGRGQQPDYLVSIDPFDGSSLFKRDLPAEWWSVATLYDPYSQPVAGGAVDILRRELYLADVTGVRVVSLDDETRAPVSPSAKTSLDNDLIIAAYLMVPSYLSDWTARAKGLLEQFPGIRIWPNGGSCVYPWLARGRIHAYLMFNEPRSEIDPGLAFARAAGFPIFWVSPDGSLEPYQFIPGAQADRVPYFIAACTRELAENIINQIVP